MKPIANLEEELKEANEKNVFGTKMRSVIYEANEEGIKDIVNQQFEFAEIICNAGLVPIIEPEVDINSAEKEKCEEILKREVIKHLENWDVAKKIMFKFTIPTKANLYLDLYNYDCVVRVVALSGGYELEKAVELLSKNNRMIASFSRALLQDLNVNQTQEEFDEKLGNVINKIYEASISQLDKQKSMIKLVLVRHGQSEWNLENKFTGWTDVNLSEKGIQEAKEAGD